jgi:hypothetical protein
LVVPLIWLLVDADIVLQNFSAHEMALTLHRLALSKLQTLTLLPVIAVYR